MCIAIVLHGNRGRRFSLRRYRTRIASKRAAILAKLCAISRNSDLTSPRIANYYQTDFITRQQVINHMEALSYMKSRHNPRTLSSCHSPHVGTKRGAAPRQRDAASALAIGALGFIAADPEELSRFLALTGIDPAAVRTAAAAPGFLGGVLAYIAGNQCTLLAFAAQAGIAPEEIEKARIVLAGTD